MIIVSILLLPLLIPVGLFMLAGLLVAGGYAAGFDKVPFDTWVLIIKSFIVGCVAVAAALAVREALQERFTVRRCLIFVTIAMAVTLFTAVAMNQTVSASA